MNGNCLRKLVANTHVFLKGAYCLSKIFPPLFVPFSGIYLELCFMQWVANLPLEVVWNSNCFPDYMNEFL